MMTARGHRACALALLLCALVASAAPAVPPDQLVRNTSDEVLAIVRNDPEMAAGDTSKLVALVEEKVLGHFDFARMTRLAVAKHWRQASSAQQEALIAAFRTLLVRTYAVVLAQFHDRRIDYAPLELADGATEALVSANIASESGKPIRLTYRMSLQNGQWKVYDILVDGVSMVINYRSLFNDTVEAEGIEGLLALLERKNAAAPQ